MRKIKRIAWNIAATLCVAAFLLCAFFFLGSLKGKLRAQADGGTEINLADYFTFHWILQPYGNELDDGTVYRYQYLADESWHDYYTTSPRDSAPESEWSAWKQVSAVSAVRSIALCRSDGFAHEIAAEFSSDLPDDLFEITYGGDYSVTGTGEYLARAEITLNDSNYRFVYRPAGVELNERGMSVVIEPGGTATVTKRWYVAHAENALLIETDGEGYTLSSWTFGAYHGEGAPRLQHGDELLGSVKQENGYKLSYDGLCLAEVIDGEIVYRDAGFENGTRDLLTFTLLREGETVCLNRPRAEWDYYFNDYAPVGSYTVIFTALPLTLNSHRAWWNGDVNFHVGEGGTEYRGFTAVYEFEVRAGSFCLQDEALNQYGKEDAEPYQTEISAFRFGNYSSFFAPASEKITFSDYIGRAEAIVSGTYWGDNAEKYFDALPRLTFRLNVSYDGEYRSAAANWGDLLSAPALFTVYYRAEMKNYTAVPSLESEQYRHCFLVNLCEEAPQLASVSASLRDESGNTVSVRVDGVRSGLSLEVNTISADAENYRENLQLLKDAGLQNEALFEFLFKDGENAVSPEGRLKVEISVPVLLKDRNFQIALVDGEGGFRVVSFTEKDGIVRFETDGLSAVCFTVPAQAEGEEVADNTALIVCLCVAGVFVLCGALVVVFVKKKSNREKGDKTFLP